MKSLLVLIVSLFGAVQAHAGQTRDLTDLMTPEEIAQEIDFARGLEGIVDGGLLWKASAEFPRLQIVINTAEKETAVNAQTLEAYLDGQLLYRTVVSTGAEREKFIPPNKKYPNGRKVWPRTWEGTYRIHTRSRNHVSSTWEGASMPFAQFFDHGIAMHATTPDHFHELGRRASGGCVRLHPRDAEIMWKLVAEISVAETQVIVYDGSKRPHPLSRYDDVPFYQLTDPRKLKTPVKKKAKKPSPKVVEPPKAEPTEKTLPPPVVVDVDTIS